jgi:peptide/nickel transport system substrate-binding protein
MKEGDRPMKRSMLLLSVIFLATFLAACGQSEPEVIEKEVTKVVKETVIEKETVVQRETVVEKETVVQKETVVDQVIVTATPRPELGPVVGGRMVYALTSEPDTLDPQWGTTGAPRTILPYVGGTLLTKDPESGEPVPYLAESYTVSDDGLNWEFKLKEGITWHDGTPFTAHDVAWTFQRGIDNPSPTTSPMLQGATLVEAVDDYTVRIQFVLPNASLANNLTSAFLVPLSRAYIEEVGDEFARAPMGVGPFKFKEWVTGERIVLERNPDFAWGPDHTHGGPPYIETLEFRFVSEYATQVLGLEAGEIDLVSLEAKDVAKFEESGQFQIYGALPPGGIYLMHMNLERPPFGDLRVRQAFNLAVDREALIKTAAFGQGEPLYGPLTSSTYGYWPGVEYIGYRYDLDRAKALMAEVGYTPGGDGILQKDGERLSLVLKAWPDWNEAQVLQQQFKALGVEIEIEQLEVTILKTEAVKGDYDLAIEAWGWPDASILYVVFHSGMVGSLNWSRVRDAQLDEMLAGSFVSIDPQTRQTFWDAAQRRIVEQAYVIPLYAPRFNVALNNRVKGARFTSLGGLELYDAYIEVGPQE